MMIATIILVISIGFFIAIPILIYMHNHKYKMWTTRIVKTDLGIYQVQCWRHDSADWECTCPLDWHPIEDFGFSGKSNHKTLKEAQKVKNEFDKTVYEWEHRNKVAEVIEGPNN